MAKEYGGFCGFATAPHPLTKNGIAVKGDHFDECMAAARALAAGRAETYPEPLVIEADPADIEGICLNPYDLEHPAQFWSLHKQGGTMASFMAVAARIPEVRRRVAGGADPKALAGDPELGACARLYFDRSSPDAASAYDCGNFLWFQCNGRHRILAARAAGQKIPVRILGRIVT